VILLILTIKLTICLEVLRERRVEGSRGKESSGEESRGEERRVERNGYPPPCLDVFKIK